MELMDTRLINNIKAGDMFVLLAPLGGFYYAERVSRRSTIWNYDVQTDAAAVSAKAVVEVLKSDCGGFIGFRSYHAEGKILQTCKDKGRILRFSNHNFDKWEQWTIYGSSLNRTLLVNRKFPDKQFEASFEEVLMTVPGALDVFLKDMNAQLIEKIKQAHRDCLDEVPMRSKAQDPNNMVLVRRGDLCDLQNSSKLHSFIDQAVSAIIQEVESSRKLQESSWVESQALKYESMLNAAYKKAQDLEVRVRQVEESSAMSRKDADEKLASLLRELDNSRLVTEGAVTDRSKLKLLEGEFERVANELNLSKSLLHQMEMRGKLARDEVEKLTLERNRMSSEATNQRVKETELLLKTKALEEELKTMSKKEENLKESLKRVEKELALTMKRAAGFESDLKAASGKRKGDFRQEKLQEELPNQSFERVTQQKKSTKAICENNQSNVLSEGSSVDANVGEAGNQYRPESSELEETEPKHAHCSDLKKSIDLEARNMDAKNLIEWQERRNKVLEEKEARNQNEISTLVEELTKSKSEILRHKEVLSRMHQGRLDVRLNRDSLMRKLIKVERKAEADMLRIKASLEENTFTQKCQELVDALATLSYKIGRLEGVFQAVHSVMKSNLEVSTITIAALDADLSCSKELISNLQNSLKEVENENDAAGSQIHSIARRFSDLNKQLTHETKSLEMQIAPLMQENEDLNATILMLQRKIQESSYAAKSQEKKLKEGLLKSTELEKEVHNLKSHLKELGARKSVSSKLRENAGLLEIAQAETQHDDVARHGSTCSCRGYQILFFFAIFTASFLMGFWILWKTVADLGV